MSEYIERDLDAEYRNDVSGTIIVNPTDGGTTPATFNDENIERWKWLILGWESMDFKQRMALFMDKMHYVNPRNNYKTEFDDTFEKEMTEFAYKYCRTFKCLQFDPDGRGVPNIIMVYHPIDINAIPDDTVKSSVRAWGIKYHFIPCNCNK